MSYTLTVPADYGYIHNILFKRSAGVAATANARSSYVIITAALSTFLTQWHAVQTGKLRTAAKVKYPNAYCSESEAKEDKAKYLFNCAQRAHANFLEHQPAFMAPLLLAGLSYPIPSAAMGLTWCVGRVVYALGYTNKNKVDGAGRNIGNFFWLPELGLQITALLTGYKMITG
ncbi:hypothetical protein MMC07_007683 [Pseudocyphellaria aurata]|nr:hypothetical protein [Pseudocyphellaria aurata]